MPAHFRPWLSSALLALTGGLLSAQAAHAAGDPERGASLYQTRCAACHAPDFNGVGPAHRGVFGRQAGTASGFGYSPALRASGVRWTAQTLDRWLTDPEAMVPGQRMGIHVDDPRDRADLIAFLQTLRAAP